jgi:signal transduction histidine kinase
LAEERPSYKELKDQLKLAEESLRRHERLAVAGRYAAAVVHEVNNPLEAIGNLVYLTKNAAEDPHQVRKHMDVVESQLARLGEITRKSLSFYREDAEPKAFDLVAIAEAAIRLHLQGSPAGRVKITKLYGMRFVPVLFKLSVFKDPYRKQVSRTTVRPWCHLFLRQQTWQETENLVVAGLRMWESR